MNVYDIGDVVKVLGVFASESVAHDPDVVKCKFKGPTDEDETTLTYGVNDELVRDSPGNYHANIETDESGLWKYRWEGWSSDVPAAPRGGGDGQFYIRPSDLA